MFQCCGTHRAHTEAAPAVEEAPSPAKQRRESCSGCLILERLNRLLSPTPLDPPCLAGAEEVVEEVALLPGLDYLSPSAGHQKWTGIFSYAKDIQQA